MGAGELRFFIESLPIAAVAAERERIAAEDFSPTERNAIAGRRVQTMAGLLALKLALVALYRSADPPHPYRPGDFVITHRPSGAAQLAEAPLLPGNPSIAVSISHTRSFAYGLAVLQEPPRG